MEIKNTQQRLEQLDQQKKLFVGLLVLVSMSLLLCLILLMSKNERVVVVPTHLNKTVVLESETVSQSYLEEMSAYFVHLFLDITPENINFHHRLILNHVAIGAHADLKKELIEESEFVRRKDTSSDFKVISIKTNVQNMTAQVMGNFNSYLGEKLISQEKKTFQFQFVYRHGALLIQSFEEIK